MKKKDRFAGREGVLMENRSVLTHRTLEEMLADGPVKAFTQGKMNQIRIHEAMEMDELKDAPVKPMPHGITPMFAALAKGPFDHPDWIYEVKWDGYRAVAEIRDGAVSLYSRNGVSFNKRFAPVAEALRRSGSDAVLDGEIVVVDDQGRPDFQMLQHYQGSGSGHLLYYAFDLLYFHGHDLTSLPLGLEQIAAVARDVRSFEDPAIIGGDFNTNNNRWLFHTIPLPFIERQASGLRRFMEDQGFRSAFGAGRPTHDALGMQLDWVFLRGFHPSAASIHPVEVSDHHALVVSLVPGGTTRPGGQ